MSEPTPREATKRRRIAKTPEQEIVYSAWLRMKDRCINPNNRAYKNYGSRGITVADEWLHDFWAFYKEIGEKPKPNRDYSIDRINNDEGYQPGNVRWATRDVQNRNRRVYKNSRHGIAGIRWDDKKPGWEVAPYENGKHKYIGLYSTFGEAANALIEYKVSQKLNAEVLAILDRLDEQSEWVDGWLYESESTIAVPLSAITQLKQRYGGKEQGE